MGLHILTCGGGDMICPECDNGLSVEWDTEYGDPVIGQSEGVCPHCDKKIMFECWTEYRAFKV